MSVLVGLGFLAIATVSGFLGWRARFVEKAEPKARFFFTLGAITGALFVVYLIFEV